MLAAFVSNSYGGQMSRELNQSLSTGTPNYKDKYVVLSVTTLAQLMAAIDATIVFLAVPSMGVYFNTNVSYMTMFVVAYIISTTALMMPLGAIGQRYGRRRPFLLGFIVFAGSSLAIVFSPTILTAILFRAIEGAGAAMMLTLAIPLLLKAFPPEERGRAVGISSASWSIGALLGPLLGGYLVSFSWQYIFLINVPIGIAGFSMGLKRIPLESSNPLSTIKKINVLGFLIFMVPLVVGIAFLNLYVLIFSAIMFPVLLMSQRGHPLVPVELITNRKYYPILVSAALQGLSFMGVLYILSVYLQTNLGLSPMAAGLALTPFPVASIVGTPIGGHLLDRTGKGGTLLISSLMMLGLAILSIAFLLQSVLDLIIPLIFAGFGGSIFWAVSTTLGVDVAGDHFRNMASGTLLTVRNAVLIVGIALFPLFINFFSHSFAGNILGFAHRMNIFSSVHAYLILLGMTPLVGAALIATTRKRWDTEQSSRNNITIESGEDQYTKS